MELINYKFTCHPKCLSVWAREVSLQQTEVVLTELCGVGGPTHVLLYSLLGGSAHFRADGPPPIHAYFLPHSKYSRTFLLQMVDTSLLACLKEFTSLAINRISLEHVCFPPFVEKLCSTRFYAASPTYAHLILL